MTAPPPDAIDEPAVVPVANRATPNAPTDLAGTAITDFGLEMFGVVRSEAAEENATISPASIAIALALLEPGTSGEATQQLHQLLGIDDPAAFHTSMNALEQDLEARAVEATGPDQDPGEITLRVANAAYLQVGYPFAPAYLDTIGTNYGPVMREVDFAPDPDEIAHEINAFVADITNDKITDLIADGVIKSDNVLALVNALYLKASWQTTFRDGATEATPFTLLDGTDVDVPMMHGSGSSSASGDGWVGATKAYVGGLEAQFILPDNGRFGEVADNLDAVFADYQTARTVGGPFALPRFNTRFNTEVSPALQSLGFTAPYANGNLMNIADDPTLKVDAVIHETFVAMDEEGTEAAAATAILARATSAVIDEPIPVVLDRPFLYRIVDTQSGATLFIGQVVDPSA